MPNTEPASTHFRPALTAVILLTAGNIGLAQPVPIGRLDFLKSKDPSIALFANTSAGARQAKTYPDELVLITGLPSNPAISARIDLLGANKPRCPGTCGGLRNVVLSPDGDTALVSSDPHDNMVSTLFLLQNLKVYARSKDPADLQVRAFTEKDFPQLDNVSGLAFGPDGRWAVVNTAGPSPIDGSYLTTKGTVVVITGLPGDPKFSAPFAVPMHSQGNIDLSLDGATLLLNDTTDFSGNVVAPKSNQMVVRGIRPGSLPRISGISTFITPVGFPVGPTPVRDARLTLDGRYAIAPIPLVSQLDGQTFIGLNQIAILGLTRNGKLEITRLLTESDGVSGGPFQAGVSPDGDSALITNVLDNGGAKLLTGLSSGNPAEFKLVALPFQFFGPPFPMGPTGPEVLAAHGQPIFTPDGDTAVVVNWSAPTVPGSLPPSLSVLTGFHAGNIRVAANLVDPALNPTDQRQQIATMPAGLQDYINLYLPPGADRNVLTSLLNAAIDEADRAQGGPAVELLVNFISEVASRETQGRLKRSQAATLLILVATGIQAINGRPENVTAAGFAPGPVAPGSIASLFGSGLSKAKAAADVRPLPTALQGTTVTIFDSAGAAYAAPLFLVTPTQINYLVPTGMSAGMATLIVRDSGNTTGVTTFDVDPVAPGLFTLSALGEATAVLVRVHAEGEQSVEAVTGPIDLGPESDQVYLVLFGTGIRGRSSPAGVSARIGGLAAPVNFAGAQGQFDGLDQVNLRLPRSLAGLGRAEIALTVDGVDANRVTVNIR